MGGILSLSEPVASDLTLCLCETFREEIIRIATSFTDIRVNLCFYPHFCTAGVHNLESIAAFIRDNLPSKTRGLYFGDAVLARRGLLPKGVVHVGPDSCTGLLAPEELWGWCSLQGILLIHPGWLVCWKEYVSEMGFDPGVPTTFYSSNLRETYLLDTGVVPVSKECIQSFETFSGLAVRVIPIGLSYLRGIVESEIRRWQVSTIKTSGSQELSAALESQARQMAVMTLLSDIARVSEEEEVISRIIMTCEALFAPRRALYLPILPEGPGPLFPSCPDEGQKKEELLSVLGSEYAITSGKDGFIVEVLYKQETVGILGVYEVSIPDRVKEYLNLALSIARSLGLAIRNARSWQEIKTIQSALEVANEELRDSNEELHAISQELQASNQQLLRSQQELQERELFINEIVNSAHVGITELDPNYTVRLWNTEMERYFGLTADEAKEKRIPDLFPSIAHETKNRFLQNALNGEIVQSPDCEYRNERSGEIFWLSSIYSPVISTNGEITGLLINVYDITQRKRAEQDLEGAYNAIRVAQEKLNILSSITRHDILNRVMVVTAYSEMLLEDISDEKQEKKLHAMFTAGKDIQHLIEFTREYQELGVQKPVWLEIADVMKRQSVQSVCTGIELTIQGISAEIYVDPMLEKVMYNLVENSRRHGENVTAIAIESVIEGDTLIISYSDNGGGVEEKEKELIFKKGHGKNTGMGLFLIREILELTHITIRECGVYGEGVRFEMTVPAGGWREISG